MPRSPFSDLHGFAVFWLGVIPFLGVILLLAGLGVAGRYDYGPLAPWTQDDIVRMVRKANAELANAR